MVRRTIVCVTAANDRQAAAVESELAARQAAGTYGGDGHEVRFFVVPDPSAARVGSGGATFNALITIEELAAASGWTLDTVRTFIVHSGGDSQRLPAQSICGKAFSALPTYNAALEVDAPIDLLLQRMFHMFETVEAGLAVASSDVLLLLPEGWRCEWPQDGATGLAIPTPKALGPNHGVYHVAPAAAAAATSTVFPVAKFFQKSTVAELTAAGAVRPDDRVLLDTGVIYFAPAAARILHTVASSYPCDCCSYLGVDMNRIPLRIELYSDVMMAMGGGLGLTLAEYHKTPTADVPGNAARLAAARDLMWAALNAVPFYAAVVEGGAFAHVGTSAEYLQLLTAPTPEQRGYGLLSHAAWYQDGHEVTHPGGGAGAPSAAGQHAVLNSLLHTTGIVGAGSVVEHCELMGAWHVGAGALVSSLRSVPDLVAVDGASLQELRVDDGACRVITVLAVGDPIKDPHTKPSARICGVPWDTLFAVAKVSAEDIWPADVSAAARTIWTARLFPAFPSTAPDAHSGAGAMSRSRSGVSAAFIANLQDRAALWLQYLPLLAAAAGGTPAIAGLDASRLSRLMASHASEEVLTLWRDADRLSLRDVLAQADAAIEFGWRRTLRGKIDVSLLVAAVAQGGNVSVTELVTRLGRGAQTVTSVTDGAGTALDDVAGAHLRLGKPRPRVVKAAVREAALSDAGAAAASPGDGRGRGASVPSSPFRAVERGGFASRFAWVPATSIAAALHTIGGGSATASVDPFAFAYGALTGLDHIAAYAPPDLAGRALAVQSALLWAMAGWGTVDHRSGPAHNAGWLHAFGLLEGHYAHDATATSAAASAGAGAGAAVEAPTASADRTTDGGGGESWAAKRVRAVALLAELRDAWLHRAHLIGRAARHYERASQLLTAQCVYTAKVAPPLRLAASAALPLGRWATASAPARIDLAGGWSDTPPITYEARADTAAAPATAASPAAADPVAARVAAFAARGGGLVVNAAVRVDGQQPIGTRARRVEVRAGEAAVVVIRTRAKDDAAASAASDAPGSVRSTLTVSHVDDLSDFNQPHAEGAIVKCALLCLGLVQLPTTSAFVLGSSRATAAAKASAAAAVPAAGGAAAPVPSLHEQLMARLGGSLEVETWSLLPHGSGLGGSSVLSATVLAAVARAMAVAYDLASLDHLVLKVEQMLSTGGGWQDQVGGMWPGVKASSCAAALPVAVEVQPLSARGGIAPILRDYAPGSRGEVAPDAGGAGSATAAAGAAATAASEVDEFLTRHLTLVYTGKTRLAKNLLQRVLRQWAMRENGVTARVAGLRENAVAMAAAVHARDPVQVGHCLDTYWSQKKGMAEAAEPPEVAAAIAALKAAGVATGASLTGAGGGGFLAVVTAKPDAGADVARVLAATPALRHIAATLTVHTATVDGAGMTVAVQSP